MLNLIDRQAAIDVAKEELENGTFYDIPSKISYLPSAQPDEYVKIPDSGIGDLSDGYHTFNGLYYQRMILFAALVKAYTNKAWKSRRHEDGELCFGGGWFIVGIDTPDGSYTYHYEDKYFDLFDCDELPVGKHWDGHTEKDVTRLLTLPSVQSERNEGKWMLWGYYTDVSPNNIPAYRCSECFNLTTKKSDYCPNCGAKMEVEHEGLESV